MAGGGVMNSPTTKPDQKPNPQSIPGMLNRINSNLDKAIEILKKKHEK